MTRGHSSTLSSDIVEVAAPGSDSFIEVFRGTARRVARIAGMSNEAIEDVTLAVDEAAMLLLESEPTEVAMSMALDSTRGLLVVLTAVVSQAPWPPPQLESDMRWHLIGAICADTWLLEGEEAGIGLFQPMR